MIRGLPPAQILFSIVAAAWMLPRFFEGHAPASPLARAAAGSVRVLPSMETGRFELVGTGATEFARLLRLPEVAAARAHLELEIRTLDDELARTAVRLGGRIELFPDEGVTGLRLSGLIVPFYDRDADRLAGARESAEARPHDALTTLAEIVETRLAEPDDGFSPEAAAGRRELTRVHHEARDALDAARARGDQDLATFRDEVIAAARRAEGPFRRRGPLRVVEVALAAMLAASIAAAVRGARARAPLSLGVSGAVAASTGLVLLLEGTDLLPVDPVIGTSLRFVPLAFFAGLAASAALESAWPRGERAPAAGGEQLHAAPPAESSPAAATNPAAAATPAPAPDPAPPPSPEPAPSPPPTAEATPPPGPPSERELPEEEPPPRPFFARPKLPATGLALPRRRRRGR